MEHGLLSAVAAAFVWGGYLFALKRYFDGYPATVLTVLVNAFAILWYLPLTLTRVSPGGMPTAGEVGPSGAGVLVVTVVATAAAFVIFLRALAVGEVSYVAPINKLVPVFVLPLEVGILQQALDSLEVAGVLVATTAVYVANYRQGALLDPLRRAAESRAAQLALLSAACYAVSDLGKRVVLQEMNVPIELWVPTLLFGVLIVLLPSALRAWPAGLLSDLPKFVLAGGLVAVGEHVTSLAFAAIPASIASPIINTQAVVAVLLGGIVLREAQFRVRLVAAGLAVAGVTLIAV
ncbi:EamA family transporter [Salinirubrum litoreum]|uniref:EamA family transporter n=1 Tax=Salinirubrum litoreum TaxID=1126234 RepID=A0ABD5RDI6_9EURY